MRNLSLIRTPPGAVPAFSLGALGFAMLGFGMLGCSSKSVAPAGTQTSSAPAVTQEQKRTTVRQSLRTMTPQERADYFKTHPEDVQLMMRQR